MGVPATLSYTMDPPMLLILILCCAVPSMGGKYWSVKQAAAMDHNISTIEDYRQYLLTVQKIYLKHTFALPIDNYAPIFGVRGAFEDPKPEMAMPAVCKPELTTVPITLANLTTSSYMFPSCTRVEQCGGCCSHPLLSCQPTQTETVIRDVLVIDVDSQTDRRETATLTRHLACSCQCATQEKHCTQKQVYCPDECKCECSNWTEKILCSGTHQLWDENLCACRCTNMETECSTGLTYSMDTCRCEAGEGTKRPPLHGKPN